MRDPGEAVACRFWVANGAGRNSFGGEFLPAPAGARRRPLATVWALVPSFWFSQPVPRSGGLRVWARSASADAYGTRRPSFGWGRDSMRTSERGSVTVELAAALPAVVIVLGLVLAAVGWARMGVTATEAASVGARIAAIEGSDAARAEIARSVPDAVVTVSAGGERVTVTVRIDGPGWLPAASATSVSHVLP